jgi:hypothetical protein
VTRRDLEIANGTEYEHWTFSHLEYLSSHFILATTIFPLHKATTIPWYIYTPYALLPWPPVWSEWIIIRTGSSYPTWLRTKMIWIQYGMIWTGTLSFVLFCHAMLYANSENRSMGQLFMMGWEGTEVTPQIRSLIEEHHLGSVILTTKNLKCESQLVHL